ncbi:MAG: hypothetical protein ACKVWR_06395, partial [Acidimicrobiales bacterium]
MVRIGAADHLGWAIAVTASSDHTVVDRRRIDLIDPGLPNAPIHHEGGPHLLHRRGAPLSDDALSDLVNTVRAAVVRATTTAFDALAAVTTEPVASISIGCGSSGGTDHAAAGMTPRRYRGWCIRWCSRARWKRQYSVQSW